MNTKTEDLVNHPTHYVGQSAGGHEPIELCELYPFALGNALKYLIRAGHKASAPEEQDLRKAKWYLARATETGRIQPSSGNSETARKLLKSFREANKYLDALFHGGVVSAMPLLVGRTVKLIDARLKEIEDDRKG